MNLNATILGQAIAFVLFVLFCMKYVWPPIINAIEKRQKEIADGLAFAENAKKDLELAQVNSTEQINKAKLQAQVIIEQANKRKSQIIEEAKAEAEQQRSQILAQTETEIEAKHQRSYEELRKKIAVLAVIGAQKIIEQSIDEKVNSDIIDKLVAEL
ncbi:F0F1 ATP synthase subunit B [Candidatus Williamhamiltonella defendens]|uniref:ATP synthase subunit b n=2 Tax=Candidatus Williamhamiltonella defendens TaxID=138072 RepID=A0A2D3SZZ3_9ENTR|nr:F0F1 ATP synthase subunit B [Candidatus Hamiltonella defensa]ACQ68876.1 membrane-bound ATP synthase, F0 sector, subunit b [Candidatus Hamiltonella defensa 5AT (Acyrthosiphon pisum)]ASV34281.1 F0F1 ATP synthase subunit B [Candidatus Hamiltonella defensa]ATW23380.1 F0F1 ATP synthase subunit B [Candidatus Hamiltonella defensa]ATW30575.1 F0F1 ATP synthase subunit B [Candidatus Hamiltonella defensa]ATW32582.1 F0F1 ATP synthase subunit B [Candidatus Hamiltonella defensa]